MSFADHFGQIAARYAAYRPRYPQQLVDTLRAETRGDTAWDVGCGNGQLSVGLAEQFARVIATDPAQAQLDSAEPHSRIEYRRAPAEASGLPDASVDLIVAAQAAHWFDWPRFLAEVARVSRPAALIALVSYGNMEGVGEPEGMTDGEAALAEYRAAAAPYWPPGREHVDNGYRDLVLPWPAVPAPAIEMTATWSRDELVGYISSWSATHRLVEAAGPAPFDALRTALARTWPDGETRVIRFPLALRFARFRAS
ncbi:MAG TPA: class I SAM-dependent methyltransferase [Kofleriaceae bacterium]